MEGKLRYPLREAVGAAEELCGRLGAACDRIEVAGSVRRGKREVADIEIVAVPRLAPAPDLFGGGRPRNLLWEAVDGLGVAYEREGDRYRRFGWRGVPVDLFTAKPGNFGWIFLIRTGAAGFSHHMAGRLNRAGYTSVGGWVTRIGTSERSETPEEGDVFVLAGEPFVRPEGRSW